MKYCSKCGKELFDDAVICVGCGCEIKAIRKSSAKSVSTFVRKKKKWIVVLTVVFLIFGAAATAIITSRDFKKTRAEKNLLETVESVSTWHTYAEKKQLQKEIDKVGEELLPYYVGIGACGTLAAAALIGDVLLLVNKKEDSKTKEG